MTYSETKRTVLALLAQPPHLGPERLPSAAVDHARLAPAIRSEVASWARSPEESPGHNREFRSALLRMVSIDCAAGAPVDRCVCWFACLGALAAWTPPRTAGRGISAEAATWLALAGRFDDGVVSRWPDNPDATATADRAVYRLFTRKPVELPSSDLHDDRFWIELAAAVERRDDAATGWALDAIAGWWLQEYRDTDTAAYEPENFSTFEPVPNAALVIAVLRDGMDVPLSGDEIRRFYYVARMVVQEPRA